MEKKKIFKEECLRRDIGVKWTRRSNARRHAEAQSMQRKRHCRCVYYIYDERTIFLVRWVKRMMSQMCISNMFDHSIYAAQRRAGVRPFLVLLKSKFMINALNTGQRCFRRTWTASARSRSVLLIPVRSLVCVQNVVLRLISLSLFNTEYAK